MELPERILAIIDTKNEIDSLQLSQDFSEDHQKMVGAIKSLESLGDVIQSEQKSLKKWP